MAVLLVAALAVPARAVRAEWGTPTASSRFGAAIEFSQPATLPTDTQRVEMLVTLPGDQGPFVSEVDFQPGTPTTLSYLYDTTGGLYPNTKVKGQWRITRADGSQEMGPPVDVVYADTRFPWKTRSTDLIRIHWYDGDQAFADKAMKLAEDGVRKSADLLGVTVTEPFDFFVYADRDGFCAAYGATGCENVGGFAPLSPDIRTLFALIPPDEIDTPGVGTVIPHELTHLVYDAVVKNPYHYPPRWLSEGFAVYMTEGNAPSYRSDLRKGVDDGTILPLEAYGNYFPPASLQSRFYLAYAESVDAVAYIVDTYGKDKLVALIRAYRDGVSDDDAMRAALGKTLAEFDAEWLKSIGVSAPKALGPRPAPAGPVPSAWLAEPSVPARPGATASQSTSAGADASATAPPPEETPAPTAAPVAGTGTGEGLAFPAFLLLLGVGLVLVVAAAVGIRRGRRTPPSPPTPAPGGWGGPWTTPATPGPGPTGVGPGPDTTADRSPYPEGPAPAAGLLPAPGPVGVPPAPAPPAAEPPRAVWAPAAGAAPAAPPPAVEEPSAGPAETPPGGEDVG